MSDVSKLKRFAWFIAIVSVLFISCAAWAQSTGELFLTLAEEYRVNAKFDQADQAVESALRELVKQVKEDPALSPVLARAHYLKANLLQIRQGAPAEIKRQLILALAAAPEYRPPLEYTSHPSIKAQLAAARQDMSAEALVTLDLAEKLAANGRFCEAYEIIKPVAKLCYGQEARAQTILKLSEKNCQAAPPVATTQATEPVQQVQEQAPAETKAQSDPSRVGVLPLALLRVKRNKIPGVNAQAFADLLQAEIPDYTFEVVTGLDYALLSEKYNVDSLNDFIVRPWVMSYGGKLSNIFKKEEVKKQNVKVGSLPDTYAEAMQLFFEEGGYEYVVVVQLKDENGDGKEYRMRLNLYHRGDPSSPVVNEFQRNMNRASSIIKKFKRIIDDIRGSFVPR